MAGRRGTGVMLLLAALAILGGTAATVLSGSRGAVPIAADPAADWGTGAAPRFRTTIPRGPEPPRQEASLTVQVLRAPDDVPIEGAEVTALCGPGQQPRVTLRTDRDGKAAFLLLLSGPVALHYEAADFEPGHGGAELRPGENPSIQVRLQESSIIDGRVVAAADGAPIAGARVVAGVSGATMRGAGQDLLYVDVHGAPMRERAATTDAEGRFRLRAGSPGVVVPLRASAEGFASEGVGVLIPSSAPATARVEIRLERDGRIRGTVKDTRGVPVAGAYVTAVPSVSTRFMRGPGGGLDEEWPTHESGPDGAYVLEGVAVGGVYTVQAYVPPPSGSRGDHRLPDGSIVLAASAAARGRSSRPVEVFLPPDTGEAVADLVVPLWGFLSVTWRDVAGRVDGAARVLAFPLDVPSEPSESLSNAVGGPGFGLNLREGRWRIVVDSEKYGCGEAEAIVVADGDARVEVIVGASPSFRGIVVDGDGNPVPWALVEARKEGEAHGRPEGGRRMPVRRTAGTPGGMIVVSVDRWNPVGMAPATDSLPGARLRARAGPDGRFLMDGLREGSKWLLFVRGDVLVVPPSGPFEVPSRDLRLVALRTGAVEGRLVLPPGSPVPQTKSLYFEGALRSTANYGDGRFRIEGLPPGRGRVWASAGELFSIPLEVEVPEGGTAEAGDVPLEAGLRLEGVVKGPDGKPCEGATVNVVLEGAFRGSAVTGADGGFVVEGLVSGTAIVAVHDGRGAPTTRFGVPIPHPDGPLEIRISRGGVLRGTARDRNGVPLAGWWVATRPAADPQWTWTPRVPVGHRGSFEVAIESGEWRVCVLSPGSVVPSAETDASVPEGGEATVDLRAGR